jgi:endonuclease/exonuclease/phosphatase family metal-dependent hydrolase
MLSRLRGRYRYDLLIRTPNALSLRQLLRHLDEAFRRKGQLMPYQAFYFPAHAYRVGQLKLYTTGLAILVNACTLHVLGHNQNEPWSVTSFGDGAIKAIKQTRILAHLKVETLRRRQFHIFNTHLSLPSPFRRDFWKAGPRFGYAPNQVHEVQQAAKHIVRLTEEAPFLLCGDFNAAPASPVYMYVTRELGAMSAQETLGQIDLSAGEPFPTAGFLKWRMHLDHLFGGKGIEWLDVEGTKPFDDAKSPFYGLSDHVPLIANFGV